MNDALLQLAGLLSVDTEYIDYRGDRRVASDEALVKILRALGAPLARPEDAADALHSVRRARWSRVLEPCAVAWDGRPPELMVTAPASARRFRALMAVGETSLEREGAVDELPETERCELDGQAYVRRRLRVDGRLPPGYGTSEVEIDGARCEASVISAPSACWSPAEQRREWGVFAPLYALRSERSAIFGGPDLRDLGDLTRWLGTRGGSVVATLPLLAGFFDDPSDGSPYSPVSAMFWNELFLELDALPEYASAARALVEAPDFAAAGTALAQRELVDYVGWYRHRRPVLSALARAAFRADAPRRAALAAFEAEPRVADYARFRAVAAAHGRNWRAWPGAMRDGELEGAEHDPALYRYHVYAQFACREQLREQAREARSRGAGLYLDLPVGVSSDSYDAWRERAIFAAELTVGAPPDALFGGGQDWGVPAIDPERSRASGHRYFADTIRAHLTYAGVLRIDHVMGLYRRFLVPRGMGPTEGVYLRYPEDELFAILCLESHRSRSIVVGEDLGTVPDEVRERMQRHQLRRIFVGQFEFHCDGDETFRAAPEGCVASFNTHDMPPFAAFWRGLDIDDRRDLGLIDDAAAADEHAGRGRLRDVLGGDERAALERCLRALAASDAWLVLVALEDLWRETNQQNTPGTTSERDNWRHRMRHALGELDEIPELGELVAAIVQERSSAP